MRHLFTLVLLVSFLGGCETTNESTDDAPVTLAADDYNGATDEEATTTQTPTSTTLEDEVEAKPNVARLTCPDVCMLMVTTKVGWPVRAEDGNVYQAVVVPKMEFAGSYEFPVFHGELVQVWVGGSLEDHDTVLEMITPNFTFFGTFWTKYGDVVKTHVSMVLPGGTYNIPYRFEVVRKLNLE